MATYTSAAAFVQNIGTYGTKIKAAEPKALQKAALAATTDIRGTAKPFHITSKRGAKVSLRASYEQAGSTATIAAKGGPWKIIEVGSRSHFMGGQRGLGRGRGFGPARPGRGRNKKVLSIPGRGRGVFAWVQHPGHGTIGHPWEMGVAKAKTSAPDAFNDTILKALR